MGRTMLAKLVYMSDVEALRYLRKPLSSFRYKYDQQGPFDAEQFYPALDDLKGRGLVVEEEVLLRSGNVKKSILDVPGSVPVAFDFTPAESRIIAWNFTEYNHRDLTRFLADIVYQTPPMVNAEEGALLDMSVLTREDLYAGIDFDVVLASESELLRGDYKTAYGFFSELLDKDTPHSPVTDQGVDRTPLQRQDNPREPS